MNAPDQSFQIEVFESGIVVKHADGHWVSYARPAEAAARLPEQSCHRNAAAAIHRETEGNPFFIEQGTVSLKKPDGNITWGKVVVDMRTGDVWGFPMKAQNTPYPVYGQSDNSKVSHPMYLGKMAFDEAVRQ
jgi:hypothetical protein